MAYAIEVVDATSFESHLHVVRDQCRINKNREFISIVINLAIDITESEAWSIVRYWLPPVAKISCLYNELCPVSMTVSNQHDAIGAFQDDSDEEV